jgi:hypothetical protein
MSTKVWLTGIIIVAILTGIMNFPGYDSVFFGAPLWLWLNIAAAFVVFGLNLLRANQWSKEGE